MIISKIFQLTHFYLRINKKPACSIIGGNMCFMFLASFSEKDSIKLLSLVEVGIINDHFSYNRNLGLKTLSDLNYVSKCLSFGNYSVVHSSNVPTCCSTLILEEHTSFKSQKSSSLFPLTSDLLIL